MRYRGIFEFLEEQAKASGSMDEEDYGNMFRQTMGVLRLLIMESSDLVANIRLGLRLYAEGEETQAKDYLRLAIEDFPDEPGPYQSNETKELIAAFDEISGGPTHGMDRLLTAFKAWKKAQP